MVSVAVRLTAFQIAVRVAVVLAVTVVVVTVKFAVVAPARTVTLAGTVAELELLLNVTKAPPTGAPPVNVTVPCAVAPPVTLAGFKDTANKLAGGGGAEGGLTVIVAVRVTPPNAAERTTGVAAVTGWFVMVKAALVAPAATVTPVGTAATAGFALVNVTTAPPLGAALVNVTVPCELFPPTTLVGFSASEESTGAAGAA